MRTQPTLPQFQDFARTHAPLAKAVLMARLFAADERQRVDAYIRPIFDRASFPVTDRYRAGYGDTVREPKDLYLCEDEALVASFYAQCDTAHRSHGFTGPSGHCPALTAETLVMEAERHLLEAGSTLMGVDLTTCFFELRDKALDILIRACVSI